MAEKTLLNLPALRQPAMSRSETMRRGGQVVEDAIGNAGDAAKVPLCMQVFLTNELSDHGWGVWDQIGTCSNGHGRWSNEDP